MTVHFEAVQVCHPCKTWHLLLAMVGWMGWLVRGPKCGGGSGPACKAAGKLPHCVCGFLAHLVNDRPPTRLRPTISWSPHVTPADREFQQEFMMRVPVLLLGALLLASAQAFTFNKDALTLEDALVSSAAA